MPLTIHRRLATAERRQVMTRMVEALARLRTLVARMSPPGLKITVEINADFPEGASDQIKRAVSENATSLEFGTKTWD